MTAPDPIREVGYVCQQLLKTDIRDQSAAALMFRPSFVPRAGRRAAGGTLIPIRRAIRLWYTSRKLRRFFFVVFQLEPLVHLNFEARIGAIRILHV